MEWTAELLLSLRETTSYPALLARLDRASSGEVSFDSRDLLEDLLEPEMKEASDEARFSLLLEEGEIGAARKLHSLLQFGSKERARIVRHASSFKQELEASLRRIMGLLLLLKDTEGERLQGLREQAEHLSNNQSLQESRPGCVLKLLEPVERELESICRRTLDDLRVVADSLQHDPTLTQNRDVTLALNACISCWIRRKACLTHNRCFCCCSEQSAVISTPKTFASSIRINWKEKIVLFVRGRSFRRWGSRPPMRSCNCCNETTARSSSRAPITDRMPWSCFATFSCKASVYEWREPAPSCLTFCTCPSQTSPQRPPNTGFVTI